MHFQMIKYDRDVVNTFIIQLFHLDSSLASGLQEGGFGIGKRERCKLKWTLSLCNDHDKNLFR